MERVVWSSLSTDKPMDYRRALNIMCERYDPILQLAIDKGILVEDADEEVKVKENSIT